MILCFTLHLPIGGWILSVRLGIGLSAVDRLCVLALWCLFFVADVTGKSCLVASGFDGRTRRFLLLPTRRSISEGLVPAEKIFAGPRRDGGAQAEKPRGESNQSETPKHGLSFAPFMVALIVPETPNCAFVSPSSSFLFHRRNGKNDSGLINNVCALIVHHDVSL